ncbi:peptide deformylase [Helicobacter sp. 13S00401-1]|uniref:peptide deformylase n=1 Tax=Helicobacter sp. 13S00401-1 TaxID=1905758 RepID=UPI000BA6ABBD|nr:peptide deformylase [Helicobacter sp. 13S00401-1]PAF50179.1 peptide deformylase [Helicobacter sp. 13S00401-1]
MILDIVKYPDTRLRQKSKEVEKFDSELHEFLDSMYETMIAKKGVGLAAIQVAKPLKIFIVNLPRPSENEDEDDIQYKEDLLEFINPVFIDKQGEIMWNEGCLSVPGFYEEIKRYESVVLEYSDRFGERKRMEAKDFLAVALQHENDHLEGILFVDKLSIIKRKKFEKELKRLQSKA